jgi:hypothetical protein
MTAESCGLTRRDILKVTGLAGAGLLTTSGLDFAADAGQRVAIVSDPGDSVPAAAPAQWALGQLREALLTRGVAARSCRQLNEVAAGETCIVAGGAGQLRQVLERSGRTLPKDAEALVLTSARMAEMAVILACGSDARGLAYALTELADRVIHAERPLAGLEISQPIAEKPANPVRSIARLFASDVEDKSWFNDKAFWRRYLTELASQRFNRFALTLGLGYDFTTDIKDAYLHFSYPFLLKVPGYDVRAVELPDSERDHNLGTLRFISDEAARRGLHFQLGLWTHAYRWTNSPNANYTIAGLTPETHAAYCRDALTALLKACPAIAGVTLRVHGESGVAEGSYDFWKAVFDGVVRSGRKIEIDLHAKGIDQPTIDAALSTGMPVTISPKFWAEHMGLPYHQAAIRPLEMPPRDRRDDGFFAKSSGSRRFLRYGYGDLLAEDRKYGVFFRMWPGTQRLLLWGDPVMAAEYGRAASFCGSLGVELCEPLSFKGRKGSGLQGLRTGYAEKSLHPQDGDWEKYRYYYRLWGRMLYNPDAEPETYRRALRSEFGAAAESAANALAHASRILPLVTTAHLPSAANNNFWPELYTNMSIVDAAVLHPYGDTPSPKRFGTVSSLDPQLFARVDDFAVALLKGESDGKYSPAEVAQWLDELAASAAKHLADAATRVANREAPAFRRLVIDVAILRGLGTFFANKLRAGVLYAIFDRSRDATALAEAVKSYRAARDAWGELSRRADRVYVRDLTFGPGRFQRGHWLDRLAAIDADIERMEKRGSTAAPASEPGMVKRAVQTTLAPPRRPSPACEHKPPTGFRKGDAIVLDLSPNRIAAPDRPTGARVHYRHVHQAEVWQVADMARQTDRWQATIAGDYTKSPYPVQYYFELRDSHNRTWLFPGLEPSLCNQPYFVVRQS